MNKNFLSFSIKEGRNLRLFTNLRKFASIATFDFDNFLFWRIHRMARKGGLSSKFYCETTGIKVTGGQVVKAGTMLTRQGDRWKPGLNVVGRMNLTAVAAGEVYFTRKRNSYGLPMTIVNIRPVDAKKTVVLKKTAAAKKSVAAKKKA